MDAAFAKCYRSPCSSAMRLNESCSTALLLLCLTYVQEGALLHWGTQQVCAYAPCQSGSLAIAGWTSYRPYTVSHSPDCKCACKRIFSGFCAPFAECSSHSCVWSILCHQLRHCQTCFIGRLMALPLCHHNVEAYALTDSTHQQQCHSCIPAHMLPVWGSDLSGSLALSSMLGTSNVANKSARQKSGLSVLMSWDAESSQDKSLLCHQ